MDFKQLSLSKNIVKLLFSLGFTVMLPIVIFQLTACKTKINNHPPSASHIDTLSKNMAIFQFEQNQSKIQINMDLNSQEFEMNFKNDKRLNSSTQFNYNGLSNTLNNQTELNQSINLNKLLFYYQKSQKSFYQGRYSESLTLVDSSLSIMKTSDALALKGSILYYLKNYQGADEQWTEAKKINPSFVKPNVKNQRQ